MRREPQPLAKERAQPFKEIMCCVLDGQQGDSVTKDAKVAGDSEVGIAGDHSSSIDSVNVLGQMANGRPGGRCAFL